MYIKNRRMVVMRIAADETTPAGQIRTKIPQLSFILCDIHRPSFDTIIANPTFGIFLPVIKPLVVG